MQAGTDPNTGKYLDKVVALGLCKDTLNELVQIISRNNIKTAVIGFNEYTKHLINIFSDNIVAVVDDHYTGIQFRGVPVISWSQDLPECKQILACDFDIIVEAKKRYAQDLTRYGAIYSFAAKYGGASTRVIDIVRQDPLLREVFSPRHRRPVSMLGDGGMSQMLEQLRACLTVEGDVADVGAWQGGSAWCMAKYLHLLGSKKRLFTFEYGEQLPRDRPRAVVCEDQMRKDLSEFSMAQVFFGQAGDRIKEAITGKLCFVFLDFGWNDKVVPYVYDRLSVGGIMLLDNYGMMAGQPDKFDAYFEDQGSSVIRIYGSTRAFVIKR